MTNIPLPVLEKLISRICHDIISPVGAVRNGVEFMEEMGADAGDEAVALIASSAESAASRLQLFRLAYGQGGKGTQIKPLDVHTAFGEFLATDKKTNQDWTPSDLEPLYPAFEFELPEGYLRITAGMLMTLHESLPKGGIISFESFDGQALTFSAKGENASIREHFQDALEMNIDIDDISPRLVHPYVLGLFADQINYSIKMSQPSEDTVFITLSPR